MKDIPVYSVFAAVLIYIHIYIKNKPLKVVTGNKNPISAISK